MTSLPARARAARSASGRAAKVTNAHARSGTTRTPANSPCGENASLTSPSEAAGASPPTNSVVMDVSGGGVAAAAAFAARRAISWSATGSLTPWYRSVMCCLASGPVVGMAWRKGQAAPRLHSPFTKKVHILARLRCEWGGRERGRGVAWRVSETERSRKEEQARARSPSPPHPILSLSLSLSPFPPPLSFRHLIVRLPGSQTFQGLHIGAAAAARPAPHRGRRLGRRDLGPQRPRPPGLRQGPLPPDRRGGCQRVGRHAQQLVPHRHGHAVRQVQQADLAHVLGLSHLLADDGLLVAVWGDRRERESQEGWRRARARCPAAADGRVNTKKHLNAPRIRARLPPEDGVGST